MILNHQFDGLFTMNKIFEFTAIYYTNLLNYFPPVTS